MTTADDKGRCIYFGAGEGLKIVAWQKFDLQKRSLLDRIWYNNSYKMHIHKKVIIGTNNSCQTTT